MTDTNKVWTEVRAAGETKEVMLVTQTGCVRLAPGHCTVGLSHEQPAVLLTQSETAAHHIQCQVLIQCDRARIVRVDSGRLPLGGRNKLCARVADSSAISTTRIPEARHNLLIG